MIPHVLARIHPTYLTPYVAILFVGILAAVGTFFGRTAIGTIASSASICFAGIIIFVLMNGCNSHTDTDHCQLRIGTTLSRVVTSAL